MKNVKFCLIAFVIVLSSCSKAIEPEDLYGRWNYIAVENFNPPDSLTKSELIEQSPAIVFSAGNKLQIEWGGKQLSHGTYKMDGKMIRYTESLEGGREREFPFLIKALGDKELVFQTMEQNYTRVKAKKR